MIKNQTNQKITLMIYSGTAHQLKVIS